MELKHTFSVPAAVQVVWDTFMDLAGVAQCFPGATVTSFDGSTFEGTCKVKLGPIALLYTGTGSFVERDDEAHRAVISANGKDRRGNGTAGATVTIALAPDGEGTSVDVTTDLSVTGKPAQFGRGVMQDVSDKLLQQFVACLEQRLASEPAPEPDTPGAGPPEEAASAPTDAGSSTAAAGATAAGASSADAAPASPVADAAPAAPAARPPAAASPAAAPRRTSRSVSAAASAPAGDDALDLGATVLPVLLRSFAPQIVAGLVGLVAGILIGRGMRR